MRDSIKKDLYETGDDVINLAFVFNCKMVY